MDTKRENFTCFLRNFIPIKHIPKNVFSERPFLSMCSISKYISPYEMVGLVSYLLLVRLRTSVHILTRRSILQNCAYKTREKVEFRNIGDTSIITLFLFFFLVMFFVVYVCFPCLVFVPALHSFDYRYNFGSLHYS